METNGVVRDVPNAAIDPNSVAVEGVTEHPFTADFETGSDTYSELNLPCGEMAIRRNGRTEFHISHLEVADAFEGQGVGKALLARAEQIAIQRARDENLSAVTISVQVGSGDSGSTGFFKHLGYEGKSRQMWRDSPHGESFVGRKILRF